MSLGIARDCLQMVEEVLRGSRQRFLHRGSGELTEARVTRRFEDLKRYFELGNKYGTWFDRYSGFLEALGSRFRFWEGLPHGLHLTVCDKNWISSARERQRFALKKRRIACFVPGGFAVLALRLAGGPVASLDVN